MSSPTVLLFIGMALELVGLGLVAYDVYAAWRQRVRLSRQHELVQVPALEHGRALAGGIAPVEVAAEPEPPSLEERVASLEREVESIGKEHDDEGERHVRDLRAMKEEFSTWIAEARREMFDLEQRHRRLIGVATAGNIWLRGIGVGLFAAGLIVQAIANIAAP